MNPIALQRSLIETREHTTPKRGSRTVSAVTALMFGAVGTLSASGVIRLSEPLLKSVKPDGIFWAFDEGKIGKSAPNPVADGSGNGFSGFLLPGDGGGEPTYVEGRFGTAIRLQPVGFDEKLRAARVSWNVIDSGRADTSALDLSGKSFTAGAWIKLNEVGQGEARQFVVFERGASAKGRSYFNLNLFKSESDRWFIRFHWPGVALSPAELRGTPIAEGGWHHVAITFEVLEEGVSLQYWFDGSPLGAPVIFAAGIPELKSERDQIFTVGERNVSHYPSNMDVSVDEVFFTSGLYSFDP